MRPKFAYLHATRCLPPHSSREALASLNGTVWMTRWNHAMERWTFASFPGHFGNVMHRLSHVNWRPVPVDFTGRRWRIDQSTAGTHAWDTIPANCSVCREWRSCFGSSMSTWAWDCNTFVLLGRRQEDLFCVDLLVHCVYWTASCVTISRDLCRYVLLDSILRFGWWWKVMSGSGWRLILEKIALKADIRITPWSPCRWMLHCSYRGSFQRRRY